MRLGQKADILIKNRQILQTLRGYHQGVFDAHRAFGENAFRLQGENHAFFQRHIVAPGYNRKFIQLNADPVRDKPYRTGITLIIAPSRSFAFINSCRRAVRCSNSIPRSAARWLIVHTSPSFMF